MGKADAIPPTKTPPVEVGHVDRSARRVCYLLPSRLSLSALESRQVNLCSQRVAGFVYANVTADREFHPAPKVMVLDFVSALIIHRAVAGAKKRRPRLAGALIMLSIPDVTRNYATASVSASVDSTACSSPSAFSPGRS